MVDQVLIIAMVLAGAGMVLALIRLLLGPNIPSRAVALDVLTLITLPLMVGIAIISQRYIYLDVALVYGILAFLGVIALARYFDQGV